MKNNNELRIYTGGQSSRINQVQKRCVRITEGKPMKTTISRFWMCAVCLITFAITGAYAAFTPQQCDETKAEYIGAIERRRTDIVAQIVEHPEMRDALLSAQMSWENTRMAELNAILWAQNCTPANPLPPIDVPPPTTTVVVEPPTTTVVVEPPTTTVVVEPPTTTVVVEPPTTTVVVEPPTTTVVVEPPTTTVVVEPPTTTVVVEPPTTTVVTEPPTTTVVVEPPTTTVVTEPPTTTVVVEPPTTTIVVEPPEGCPKKKLKNSDACKGIMSRWEKQRDSICGERALQEFDDMFHAQLAANACPQHSGHYCTPGFSHGQNKCKNKCDDKKPPKTCKHRDGHSCKDKKDHDKKDCRDNKKDDKHKLCRHRDGHSCKDSREHDRNRCPEYKGNDKKDDKKDCKKVSIKYFRHQDGHSCRLTRAHDRKGCSDPSRKG